MEDWERRRNRTDDKRCQRCRRGVFVLFFVFCFGSRMSLRKGVVSFVKNCWEVIMIKIEKYLLNLVLVDPLVILAGRVSVV